MISYKPLLKLLIDENIKKLEFAKKANISTATLAKLSKDEYVSLEIINKIGNHLSMELDRDIKIEEMIYFTSDLYQFEKIGDGLTDEELLEKIKYLFKKSGKEKMNVSELVRLKLEEDEENDNE